MSVAVPENMEEVAMKIAQHQVRGEQLTVQEVIEDAVKEILQAFMDEALEGHYDDVKLEGQTLVVYDFMGREEGQVTPEKDWVTDFQADADAVIDRLEEAVGKIVRGR